MSAVLALPALLAPGSSPAALPASDRRIAGVVKLTTLQASYEELVALFGEPERVAEIPSRLRMEWRLAFSGDQVAVLHDCRADDASLGQHRRAWTLLGHHQGIATRIEALLATLRLACLPPATS